MNTADRLSASLPALMATSSAPAAEDALSQDFARVEITTPLPVHELREFIGDVERLLRINPLYEFTRFEWQEEPDGSRIARIEGHNHATGRPLRLRLAMREHPQGLELIWQGWLKGRTLIEACASDDASASGRLVITDDYGHLPPQERERRKDEVDTSLLPWAHALHRHLRWRPRLRLLPGALWLTDRFWLRMKPAARRISAMLIILTLAELIIFAAIILVFRLAWPA
jgi:hypothetical protein